MRISYCDLEQAESRTVGAILYRLFADSTYLDVQENSGDPHTLVCSMCWGKLPWPQDYSLAAFKKHGAFPPDLVKAARKVADMLAFRSFSYRDLGKRLSHGTNYIGTPRTMSAFLHVKEYIVARFQEAYFGNFHAIGWWHDWVRETVEETRTITTMLGRRRIFFDRPTAPETIREAVAFEPQSVATGDYMNKGAVLVQGSNLPLFLNKQVHDAIAFTYDARDEFWLIPEVCRIISWPIILTPHPDQIANLSSKRHLLIKEKEILEALRLLPPREFRIPVEAKVGWNLGRFSLENPNGLLKFSSSSPDSRIRVPTKPFSATDMIVASSLL